MIMISIAAQGEEKEAGKMENLKLIPPVAPR